MPPFLNLNFPSRVEIFFILLYNDIVVSAICNLPYIYTNTETCLNAKNKLTNMSQ